MKVVFTAMLLASLAEAQSVEDEWVSPPTHSPAPEVPPPMPPPAPLPLPLPLRSPSPSPSYTPPQTAPVARREFLRPRAEVLARVQLQEDKNQVSMLAAPTLGAGNRGQLLLLGFPLLSLRALFGLTERFDLGVGFDSYYFLMNEPRLAMRLQLVQGAVWSLAASLEAGYAFFAVRSVRESFGARQLTGHRNINVSPGVVVARQGASPRAARLFLDLRYTLALDTEPFSTDPLVGVPPAVVPGHMVTLKGGAELPLSSRTALVVAVSIDVRSRKEDPLVMPGGFAGLVTSF